MSDAPAFERQQASSSVIGRLVGPLMVACAGVAIIGAASYLEDEIDAGQVWKDAALVLDSPIPPDRTGQAIPVTVRRLPDNALPVRNALADALRDMEDAKDLFKGLKLDQNEYFIAAPLSEVELSRLLVSGRAPQPGKREVLAGDLVRFDHFDLEGDHFEVVGRLQRGVSGLTFAYLIPDHEAIRRYFAPETGAAPGWIDPEWFAQEAKPEENLSYREAHAVRGGMTRTDPRVGLITILGLVLVAAGGSVFQVRLFRWLCLGRPPGLVFAMQEIAARPRLVVAVHILLYGAFFALMLTASEFPLFNYRLVSMTQYAFHEGGLDYIGAAYESRNVLLAAGATLVQNYLVATVALTILPSLFIPFAGVVKNVFTFGVVGFTMAPFWTGTASEYTFHSITMTLELEAYIVATFLVVCFPIRVLRGIRSGEFVAALRDALRLMLSGTLLCGIMLTIAALYEAASIIFLRGTP